MYCADGRVGRLAEDSARGQTRRGQEEVSRRGQPHKAQRLRAAHAGARHPRQCVGRRISRRAGDRRRNSRLRRGTGAQAVRHRRHAGREGLRRGSRRLVPERRRGARRHQLFAARAETHLQQPRQRDVRRAVPRPRRTFRAEGAGAPHRQTVGDLALRRAETQREKAAHPRR